MALAKATVVSRVRRLLTDRPWETTSTTATTSAPVAVPDGTQWAAGDILEWTFSATGTGEQALVRSVSTNDLTVLRGYGSVAPTAHASGDRVIKNPTFSYDDIVESIDETLNGLWPNAWKAITQTVTPDSAAKWIDSGLSATELDALVDFSSAVQVYNTDDLGVYGPHQRRRIKIRRNMPSGTWASAVAVAFPDGYYSTTASITMIFRGKITDTITTSNYDDLDDGNSLTEAVVWLAAGRLLMKKEATHEDDLSHLTAAQDGAFFEQKGREHLARYRQQLMIEVPRYPNHVIGG
jgi:hypothetical protein